METSRLSRIFPLKPPALADKCGQVSGNGVYQDLAAGLAYSWAKMENISKADALSLVSKWDRQNRSISVFCLSSMTALISNSARVVLCLDDCINLSLADESELRIFTSEAFFARVGPEDFPMDFVSEIPKFQQAISIDFPGKQMRFYLAA